MSRPLAVISLLALTVAAALGFARGDAGAQDAGGHRLAVVIQAGRYAVAPGTEVHLAAGLENQGSETLHLTLSCAPPVDFEVRGPDGTVVWHQESDCHSDDLALTLSPGQRRLWEATWPGSPHVGEYTAYAVVHTEPRDGVAGPIPIVVREGGDAPQPTEHPHETDSPHPTEHPGETAEPHPTEHPGETAEPHPTEHPGETAEPHPTEHPGETAEPHPTDHPTEEHAFPGDAFPVADWGDKQSEPDVDGKRQPGDCQHLVVWLDDAEDGIFGRFVEANWRGEAFRISADTVPAGAPRVAYNAERSLWLVVWTMRRENGNLDVVGRYVQCGDLEGAVFEIGEGELDDTSPAVASRGEGFVVAWVRSGPGSATAIRGAGVDGFDVHWNIELADGPVGEPAVACRTDGQCFVVWTRGDGAGRDILGRRWWPDQERADGNFAVASTDAPEHDPSIAAGDGDRPYLVTWTKGGEDASSVWGRLVHQSGERVVGDAFQLSGEGRGSQSDVSPAATGFNVVWTEALHDVPRVRGRFVTVADTASPGPIADVSPSGDGGGNGVHPAAATADSGVALAVWETSTDADPGQIFGRYIRWNHEGRVVLLGRVTGTGSLAQAAGSLDVRVERVLEGSFPCTDAHVYYAADTQLPPELRAGDRLYIVGEIATEGAPCTLDVASPGTLIAAAGPERLFAPMVLKDPE